MTAEEIKSRRTGLGMTQRDLGAYLGKSWWTVAQWEQGRRVPDMDEFSLRVAFATAKRAIDAGESLPDWRTAPVLPGLEDERAPVAGATGGRVGI
jgi:DNA-binding XRE family transcriptional regulator